MSLRLKLLLPLLFASLAAFFYISAIWGPRTLEGQKQAHLADARHHLETVVSSLLPLMLTRQLDLIHENLEDLRAKNTTWEYVELRDAEGHVLFETGSPAAGAETSVLEQSVQFRKKIIGRLAVRVSYTTWLAAIRTEQRHIEWMLLALVSALAVVLGTVLELAVIRPLGRMAVATRHMAERHFDLPLPEPGGDEVGALILNFQAMRREVGAYAMSLMEENAARRDAESRIRHFKDIVDSSDDAIISTDLEGKVRSWNLGAEVIFGYTEADMVGRTIFAIVPEDKRAEESDILARIARGERVVHFETVRMHRDGRPINISATISPVPDALGQIVGTSKIARDISAQKRAELELEQHRHHLEKLVAARTEALSVAKEMAEAASRSKSMFLANMSHELRTPLNGILGMTDLAARRASDPKQMDYLEKSAQSARHLLAIINDVLDISRLEAEKMTLESDKFRLGSVVDDALGLVREDARKKGLELHRMPDDGAQARLVRGDPVRLRQILLNLLDNAVKFTEEGSITLSCSLLGKTDKGSVFRFAIQDTGIGINPEDQNRLFNAFEQADGSFTRRYGGTGLGLAISKRLVQLMGGNMGVDSAPGKGSRFHFTVLLPEAASPEPAMPSGPAA